MLQSVLNSQKIKMTNKVIIIMFLMGLILLVGCNDGGDFRCDNISPSSIIDHYKIKTWNDCHEWLSNYCNMNVSKTYCEGLPLE